MGKIRKEQKKEKEESIWKEEDIIYVACGQTHERLETPLRVRAHVVSESLVSIPNIHL